MSEILKENRQLNDIVFNIAGEKENVIISNNRYKALFKNFKKRLLISALVFIFVLVFELIGKYNTETLKEYPAEAIFITIFFIIFNVLSWGYVILKGKISGYADHVECIYGNICEKYDNRELSANNHEQSKNYILFDTDTLHCITAMPVNDNNIFKALNIGDRILIVKSSPYGDVHYELYTDI